MMQDAAQALVQDRGNLANLNDIVGPAPVSSWPLAPGWYVLIAVAAVGALVLTGLLWRRWRRNAYRRTGLVELQRIAEGRGEPLAVVAALSVLLKRVALVVFPRSEVAPLAGEEWVAFLNRTGGGFDGRAGNLLATAPFDPRLTVERGQLDELVACTGRWIRTHEPC